MKLLTQNVLKLCDTEKQVDCVNGIIKKLSDALNEITLIVYRRELSDGLVFCFREEGYINNLYSRCVSLDEMEWQHSFEVIECESKRMIEDVKATYLRNHGIIY